MYPWLVAASSGASPAPPSTPPPPPTRNKNWLQLRPCPVLRPAFPVGMLYRCLLVPHATQGYQLSCVFPCAFSNSELWSDRDTGRELGRLQRALSMIHGFRDSVAHQARALDAQQQAMHSVLTPDQSVRLMLWLSRNRHRVATEL
jgi:hypothetical protein